MKKVSALLLVFLFLITNSGMAVTMHWCGGKLSSIHFFSEKHSCPCGKKAMKSGCCKDKTTTFQLNDEQQKTQECSINHSKVKGFQLVLADTFPFFYQISFIAVDFYNSKHPPGEVKHPLYLQHRTFRIWFFFIRDLNSPAPCALAAHRFFFLYNTNPQIQFYSLLHWNKW